MDVVLGANMLCRPSQVLRSRALPYGNLSPQEYEIDTWNEIQHLAKLGVIDTTQVLEDELVLMFSRKNGT